MCGNAVAVGDYIEPRPRSVVEAAAAAAASPAAAASAPACVAEEVQRKASSKATLDVAWIHARCTGRLPAVSPCDRPLCMHWKRGACKFERSCWFRHGTDGTDPSPPPAAQPSKRLCVKGGRSKGRKALRNSGTALVFRRFLYDKFGHDALDAGEGVLDVAGGKGELGFVLRNVSGVRATVVDPRPLDLGSFEKRFRRGMYHRSTLQARTGCDDGVTSPASFDDPDTPRHLRMFFDSPLLSLLSLGRDDGAFSEHFRASTAHAVATAWTSKGLVHEGADDAACGGEEAEGEGGGEPAEAVQPRHGGEASGDASAAAEGGHVTCPAQAYACLTQCSCVVGLHPDQAVDAIVDYAVAKSLPFAVVPCCVYSKDFPKRKDPADPLGRTQVTSYEQLLRYLKAKHPSIQQETLDFEGKNIVLWWDGCS